MRVLVQDEVPGVALVHTEASRLVELPASQIEDLLLDEYAGMGPLACPTCSRMLSVSTVEVRARTSLMQRSRYR